MNRTTITPTLLLHLARVRLGTSRSRAETRETPNPVLRAVEGMRTFTLKDATTISGIRDPGSFAAKLGPADALQRVHAPTPDETGRPVEGTRLIPGPYDRDTFG